MSKNANRTSKSSPASPKRGIGTYIGAWIEVCRPKTLSAIFVPILAATALAWSRLPELRWGLFAYTLLSGACLQIATNFVNDVVDHDKGADGPDRLGPRRGLQRGVISRHALTFASGGLFGLAVLFGAPLIDQGGWIYLAIGLAAIFFAWAYTGDPLRLAYRGLGDFFVLIFFGWVATAGTYYVQTLRLSDDVWVLGTQMGLLATALIVINNLRDVAQDKKARKRTLVVLFGKTFARIELTLLLLVPYALNLSWWPLSRWAALLPLATLPLALWLLWRLWVEPPSTRHNRYLALAGLLHLIFGLLLSTGFVLGET